MDVGPAVQHDLLVSGIDWSPVTNLIVTCSHDRNAFVWAYNAETDKFEPTISILKLDRAALAVKWSPDGVYRGVTRGVVIDGVPHVAACVALTARRFPARCLLLLTRRCRCHCRCRCRRRRRRRCIMSCRQEVRCRQRRQGRGSVLLRSG